MFSRVSAVAVYVTDLERATRFYTEVLEFEVRVAVSPTLCFLHSPAGNIEIYLEGGHDPNPGNESHARLSFFLWSEQSAFKIFEHLRAHGVSLMQERPEQVDADIYTFQFKDPDDNIIEVAGKG
jgi:catechol 2,3-dioxygenase-like lactoylglutathione lyase family enzyme